MMATVTPRQHELLRAIQLRSRMALVGPSVRELCEALGVSSTFGVHGMLMLLEKRGFVTLSPTGYRLTRAARKLLRADATEEGARP